MRNKIVTTFALSTYTLLALTGAAFSQQGRESGENPNTWSDKQDTATLRAAEEQKRQKEPDAQYKATLGRMKAPIAPSDPWGMYGPSKPPPLVGLTDRNFEFSVRCSYALTAEPRIARERWP
jgi:hypothetical protein